MEAIKRVDSEARVPVPSVLRIERAETTPPVNTKDPTPMSMSDVPQFSTFANRRGKMRKSTARMAMQVITIIEPR